MSQGVILCGKFRWAVLLTTILWVCDGLITVSADAIEEYTAKSLLALNLARFTEWPAEYFKEGRAIVNVCVLGDAVVQQAFFTQMDHKNIGERTLFVHNINDSKQLEQCRMLFISEDFERPAHLLQESQKRSILTIGESDDFLEQGGMVYLQIMDTKIKLHVNLKVTEQAGLRISARVLRLATIFNS